MNNVGVAELRRWFTSAAFVLCACACNNEVVMMFKNQQASFRDKTSDQDQCLFRKRRQRKMHKHRNTVLTMKVWSSLGTVMWAAIHHGFHHLIQLIPSIITIETIIQLMHKSCGSVRVSTKVLIKHLVSERKYSRKYNNPLWAHIYWCTV